MLTARIYMRVSTDEQDLLRQNQLIDDAKNKGFYIAGVYREKISGNTEWTNRPELHRLINDLQSNDIVVAESIDRLTRLEPIKALELVDAITSKGAKIQVPEIFDFEIITGSKLKSSSDFDPNFLMSDFFAGIQRTFLKIAVSIAHHDYNQRKERQKQGIALAKEKGKYKGKQANIELHKAIIEQRKNGISIVKTAKMLNTSESTVIRVWRLYNNNKY